MNWQEIENKLTAYLNDPTTGSNIVDLELRKITALLGITIAKLNATTIKLDETSSRLSKANIALTTVNVALTVVILLVGIVQIWLMANRH